MCLLNALTSTQLWYSFQSGPHSPSNLSRKRFLSIELSLGDVALLFEKNPDTPESREESLSEEEEEDKAGNPRYSSNHLLKQASYRCFEGVHSNDILGITPKPDDWVMLSCSAAILTAATYHKESVESSLVRKGGKQSSRQEGTHSLHNGRNFKAGQVRENPRVTSDSDFGFFGFLSSSSS